MPLAGGPLGFFRHGVRAHVRCCLRRRSAISALTQGRANINRPSAWARASAPPSPVSCRVSAARAKPTAPSRVPGQPRRTLVERAVAPQPHQQVAVADPSGREARLAKHPAKVVQRGGGMGVGVGIHPAGDFSRLHDGSADRSYHGCRSVLFDVDRTERNSRSGGQHSDEARPSSYQVTLRPAGALAPGRRQINCRAQASEEQSQTPRDFRPILTNQAARPSSL